MMNTPWSKKHKSIFGKCQYSLSNSFAEPLVHAELIHLTRERGDDSLVEMYHNHSLEYTPNGGSLDLREEIAKLYDSPTITAHHILVTTGAQVALQTAALSFGSDCHSIVFVPGYQSTVEFLSTNKSSTTQIRRSAQDNWQVDIRQVKEAIRPNTKFLILNEPHNPSGTCMSRETQVQLIQLAREYDIVILCDEVYRLLEHDPTETRLPAMCTLYEKGISCVTLSKPWGACGVTIGWLACPSLEMKEKLTDVQYFGTACPSRASEIQAIMILRASNTILEKNMSIIQCNKKLLQDFMEEYQNLFEWTPPTAGAICFIKFKGPLSSEEFGNLLQSRGISCKPAYCFTDTVIPEIDYFRVGFGEAKFPKALEALKVVVEEYQDEWRTAGNAKLDEESRDR
jgi:aspartate/methionine/tyrosine aminotransferase